MLIFLGQTFDDFRKFDVSVQENEDVDNLLYARLESPHLKYFLQTNRPVSSVVQHIAIDAGGLGFDSQAG